jgi:1,4-alpha-glucan branching enzyme
MKDKPTPAMTKITKNKRARPHPGGPEHAPGIEICLEFTRPNAVMVFVAGTFNDWHPTANPMNALGEGRWIVELRLPPGRHEYCLIVDGEWIPDPLAGEWAPNPFGGANSVLHVPPPK